MDENVEQDNEDFGGKPKVSPSRKPRAVEVNGRQIQVAYGSLMGKKKRSKKNHQPR